MFQHLAIKNYILIQDIQVDLTEGFNVFTGETGSGKSMLVDAMNFITGQRSSASVVGNNGTSARVEAVLSLPAEHAIYTKLNDLGLNEDEESTIILTREMTQDGRNTFRINNRLVSLSITRECLEDVIDIHSQHETQYLLNAKNHLNLLDEFANTSELVSNLNEKFEIYTKAKEKYNQFKVSDISPNEIKLIQKELDELEAFKPSTEDYELLEEQLKSMENFEKYQELYSSLLDLFNNDQSGLGTWYAGIDVFEQLDDELLLTQYKDAYYSLEDIQETLVKKKAELNFDPFEFDRLQERLFKYQQYIRRYSSVEGITDHMVQIETTIKQAQSFDDTLIDFENEMNAAYQLASELAQTLSIQRKEAASRLEDAITVHLDDLLLENARFKVVFKEQELHKSGIDSVVFYVAMNKGSDFSPLDKVASGGELSRLMLGLKVIFNQLQGISTVVFDEIDTGVSGRVGIQIGAKMKQLAETTQVLTITHLSSVAACATSHFSITKADDADQTVTSIEQVTDDRRVEELALIMSGSTSNHSLAAAKELLKEGQAI